MRRKKIRFAVVGLGHIAQVAVLPAFKHSKGAELAALVSGNARKLKQVGRQHRVSRLVGYDEYDLLLASGEIDAVYIALPNDLHRDYAVRAAQAGVHVLCEKPLAVSSLECEEMIAACERHRVKLMTAYRLHFERSNLRAIQEIRRGAIGDPRLFESVFGFKVREDNIRTRSVPEGGGPVYDIGIYCINAARCLFGDEPLEVSAIAARGPEKRFREIPETVSVSMRFPGERIATFTVSYGIMAVAQYRVVGTRGDLLAENPYEYAGEITQRITVDGRTRERTYGKRDQFAPELEYFSECILKDRAVEPDGREGLADVRVIEAIHESIESGCPISLDPFRKRLRPGLRQAIRRPAVREPKLHEVQDPHEKAA